MSTYREIRRLQAELTSNSKITARRAAGQELAGRLGRPEVRDRLMAEASELGGTRGTIQRRTALKEMWRSILQSSLTALQKITTSQAKSSKLQAADLATFLRLLQHAAPSAAGDDNDDSLYEPPRLSRKICKHIFTVCYDLLQDEAGVYLDIHGVEMELWRVLEFLCSSCEHVAFLRPHVEIDAVVQEMESRILGNSGELAPLVGKVWENLFVTTTRKLHMGLPLLLPGCVRIVSSWCRSNAENFQTETQAMQQELTPLLRGLSALLLSDQEQAVAPLTRHGRPILSMVKKDYATCETLEKINARNEYFLAHLRVAQTAGKLQGLMPGDLGDLGNASLTKRQLTTILDVLLGRILKRGTGTKQNDEAAVAWPLNADARTQLELVAQLLACAQRLYLSKAEWQKDRRTAAAGDSNEMDVDENDDSITATLISRIEREPSPDDYLSLERRLNNRENNSTASGCPVAVLARSPFMEGVLRVLYGSLSQQQKQLPSSPAAAHGGSGAAGKDDSIKNTVLDELMRLSSEQQQSRLSASQRQPGLSQSQRPPSLASSQPSAAAAVASAGGSTANTSATAPTTDNLTIASVLRILTVCANVFPTGECWTSNTTDNWHVLRPPPSLSPSWSIPSDSSGGVEEAQDREHLSINACSPGDLALVIDVVAGILESCDGPSGDEEVQRWSLHCLRALTTCTATLVFLSHQQQQSGGGLSSSCACLEASWRNVWNILLQRPDCGYQKWTQSGGEVGSKGELLLQLLFEMIRRSCLDCAGAELNESPLNRRSAFVFRNQTDLWNLPVFSPAGYTGVVYPAPLLLIYAVLSAVGLSEQGGDMIHVPVAIHALARDSSTVKVNRRTRLVVYCMNALECEGNHNVRAIACACIGALISGEASMIRGVLLLGSDNNTLLDHYPGPPVHGPKRDLLSELWTTPSFSVDLVLSSSGGDKRALDCSPEHAKSRLLDMLAQAETTSRFSDFVPSSQAESLLKYVFSKFAEMFESTNESPGDDTITDAPSAPSAAASSGEHDVIPGIVRRILSCKLSLTIMVSTLSMLSIAEQTKFFEELTQLFRSISTGVGAICDDRDSFWFIFGQVHGLVRAVTGAIAQTLLPDMSDACAEAASLFFDTCEALLEQSGFSEDPKAKKTVVEKISDDFMEESDEDTTKRDRPLVDSDDEGPRRKRRKRSEMATPAGRKRVTLERGPPGQDCTFMVASLLLSLRPSPSVCEFVAATLLGVDRIGEDELPTDIDVLGGAVAATMICTEDIFLFPYAADKISSETDGGVHRSLVLLICRVIAGIRSASSPQCKFHLFGFDICSKVVRLAYQTPGYELSEEETRFLTELILEAQGHERKSLNSRPRLRDAKLQCGVIAFRCGESNFHEQFDREFPRSLVLPSLYDLNGVVRCRASTAVAAALRNLTEDKVLESVRKRLPVFFNEPGEEEERANYRSWYDDKNLGYGEEFHKLESQVWEDQILSVRYGTLSCWCEIARATSHTQTMESYLFELVCLASVRPDLEGLCFLMLDRIARARCYTSADSMLAEYSGGILSQWIQSGRKVLDLPLVLGAPFLLRNLLRSGRVQDFYSESGTCDAQKIRYTAAAEFVSRNSYLVLPQIMFHLVSSFVEPGVTRDFRRRFMEEESVKDFCGAFTDSYDDDIVRDAMRTNVGDIAAVSSWKKSTSDGDPDVAVEVERLMTGLLDEDDVRRQGETTGHRAVRRLLALATRSPAENAEKSDVEFFLDATKLLAQVLRSDPVNDGIESISSLVGSTTELLVFARYLLMERIGRGCPGQVWLPMEIVLAVSNEQIRRGMIDLPQLQFSFQLLSNVLVDPKLKSVRCEAVRALKDLIEVSLSAKDAPAMGVMLIESLHLVSDILGQNLESFFTKCKQSKFAMDESLRWVLGLRGGFQLESDIPGDAWGWNSNSVPVHATNTLLDHVKTVSSEMSATLDACRDLLELILSNRETAHIENSEIYGVYQASKLSLWGDGSSKELHPAFGCHQQFDDLMDTDSNDRRVPRLRILSRGHDELRSLSLVRQNKQHLPSSQKLFFSIDEKHLIDELGQLSRYLSWLRYQRHASTNGDVDTNQSGLVLTATLLDKLGELCSSSFPDDIRVAASRCLGEVELSRVNMDKLDDCGDGELWLAEAVKSGTLLRTLQARSIEALVESLQPSDPQIGLVAVETLRALLSTRIGVECQGHITNERTLALLKPFASQSRKALNSELLLTDDEVDSFISGSPASDVTRDTEWCWDARLWQHSPDKDTPFEKWICCVVPALLICCYGRNSNSSASQSGVKATRSFFGLCQRMSSLEPRFASRLFPSIILDLLLNADSGHEQPNLGPVLIDTWVGNPGSEVNRKISRCFAALLKSCTETGDDVHSGNQGALELAVDTIGIMYQLTQHRFSSSRSHRKNVSSLKAIKGGEQNQSHSSQETNSASYRSDSSQDKRSWDGLRFGTVLRLDGLLVARACLRAGRPSSALFYAELYGDNRFGGSTSALVSIVLNAPGSDGGQITGTSDISGFGPPTIDEDGSQANVLETSDLECGGKFLSVIHDCFSDLEEKDASEAAAASIADLAIFSGHNCLLLDNGSLDGRHGNRNPNAIEDTLESLGNMGGLSLDMYISSLTAHYNDILPDLPRDELIEKALRCRILRIPWDDRTFEFGDSTVGPDRAGLIEDFHSREDGFHALLLNSIKALRGDDYPTSLGHLMKARQSLTKRDFYQKTHGFFGENMLSLVDRSKALNHLETIARNPGSLGLAFPTELGLDQVALGLNGSEMRYHELADCTRELTLRHACAKAKRSGESNEKPLHHLLDHMWQSFYSCCIANQHKKASGVLRRLQSVFQSMDRNNSVGLVGSALRKLQLEEAQLLYQTNDFTGAIRGARRTIRLLESRGASLSAEDNGLLAQALVKCGEWMTKHNVEAAHSILDSYLKPGADLAVSVLEKQRSSENAQLASSALLAVSQLASSIFDTVSARVGSLEWQHAGSGLKDRKNELQAVSKLMPQQQGARSKSRKESKGASKQMSEKEARDLRIYYSKLKREIDQTEQERTKILQSVQVHQKLVLTSTGKALEIAGVASGPSLSNFVYRMVDIWFAVLENNGYSEDLDYLVSEAIDTIPSFRFVPLSSQLFSRLDSSTPDSIEGQFQARLHTLLLKLCLDHPYHCLVQLVALSNGTKVGDGVNGLSADTFLENTAASGRVGAAMDLMQRLRKQDDKWVADLVDSYQTLANAYIHLANTPTQDLERGNTAKISFSKVCKKNTERLDACLGKRSLSVPHPPCVLTKPPPIRPGCDYGEGVTDPIGGERVGGFESHFAITDGGVHRPKIVVCLGTKGGKFKQLVKGEDEIRQDAVMQQVFVYVNELTAARNRSKSSSGADRQRLNLVTYNIVPLSPASGVLEWVEQSMAFGEFMQDRSSKTSQQPAGGHSRYYPGEWGVKLCKDMLKNAAPDEKRAVFDNICAHTSPSFRFFFVERFGHSPDSWYDAKLRYTRSVAVNSIVGHILGIGDRHCSNILVHKQTGVVVHIDFGIVFEQGKLLAKPELVPFRLTRNIVDGMGPLGTEGVFMNAAKASLEALKDNSNALLTILSSIANDPLYSWCLSPVKMQEKQAGVNEDSKDRERQVSKRARRTEDSGTLEKPGGGTVMTDRNQAASRAIARVREKLQGYEHGTSGEQQSVEGQVQLLVNSACDCDNLSQMFEGWAAWV